MDTSKLYLPDFPQQHKVKDVDVVTLYHERKFEELDAVVICKDRNGIVTATFGQNNWNCLPFSRNKDKNQLKIDEFDNMPDLQQELKILTFGWLFNKNPKQKIALKFGAIHSRLSGMKTVYRFLAKNNHHSIKALTSPMVWHQFEAFILEGNYAKSTIENIFVAINCAIHDSSWHKLGLNITPIKPTEEARRLSNKETQQTLIIPERLCDLIYAKAIDLIEGAYPHRQLIADTENALHKNYLAGKIELEKKITQGRKLSFVNADGSISASKLAIAIKGTQPKKANDIIALLAEKLPNIPLKNGNDFKRYLGQLTTASYIVCGGFSGMRSSELQQLTPHSYFQDTFEGRDFHLLQSQTFKLGEKQETWVTASTTKTAIELMSTLTERWRNEANYPNEKHANSLWVSQTMRSRPPVIISDWNSRLKRFCATFGFTVTKEDYLECLESNPHSLANIQAHVVIGKPWPMSTHQFRRTLAFYCIKNRLGTLVALKQQFKHLYLAMTEWYTNGGRLASLRDLKVDEQVQKALDEINAETTANKIFKQWHSDETLSGTHGKAIMKMRGDVPTIYSSWDVIYKAVKDGKLTLHGSMHSYCKSGYDCDMDGVVAPQFCVECGSGSSIIDEQQANWWQKKHCSLVAYMESGEDISVSEQSHYITQIRAAEKVIADFDMPFTPFEPDLRVANL